MPSGMVFFARFCICVAVQFGHSLTLIHDTVAACAAELEARPDANKRAAVFHMMKDSSLLIVDRAMRLGSFSRLSPLQELTGNSGAKCGVLHLRSAMRCQIGRAHV